MNWLDMWEQTKNGFKGGPETQFGEKIFPVGRAVNGVLGRPLHIEGKMAAGENMCRSWAASEVRGRGTWMYK